MFTIDRPAVTYLLRRIFYMLEYLQTLGKGQNERDLFYGCFEIPSKSTSLDANKKNIIRH